MLKARIVTGLVLAPLVLAGLVWLGTTGVAVLIGLVMAAGGFEWAGLCQLEGGPRVLYVLAVAALCALSLAIPLSFILFPALAWWLYATWDLVIHKDQRAGAWRHSSTRLAIGLIVLIPAWRACVALKASDPLHPQWLLLLVFLVWTADTAAYFAGRAFGRRRLAPQVSPGKTVEGVAGGVAAAALLGFGWVMIAGYGHDLAVKTAVFAMVVALFSVVGDLTESKAKRLAGVKDSGHWLPGHGGILDRIDALTAAAPVFVLGIRWLAGDRS
ncbi:MAG: phosphatidate cytidylyltransferase [Gammaproteobacteria bacterium]|nr:phosphatidate cytidylyltransferase [Gammaproteobacteria bacterium]